MQRSLVLTPPSSSLIFCVSVIVISSWCGHYQHHYPPGNRLGELRVRASDETTKAELCALFHKCSLDDDVCFTLSRVKEYVRETGLRVVEYRWGLFENQTNARTVFTVLRTRFLILLLSFVTSKTLLPSHVESLFFLFHFLGLKILFLIGIHKASAGLIFFLIRSFLRFFFFSAFYCCIYSYCAPRNRAIPRGTGHFAVFLELQVKL